MEFAIESLTKDGVTGSWLTAVLPVKYVQSRFDSQAALDYLRSYWSISVIGSIIYVFLVFGGRKVMEKREPFSLRKPLILWNGGLSLFSILGSLSIIPSALHCLFLYGITYSLCNAQTILDSHQTIWGFLFVLSKFIEFGDTLFIVLRKKPLLFLHWYHHITVCIYSCYMTSGVTTDVSRWFGAMNYGVHSIMYSYYTIRAAGYYVPSRVALVITLLQLAQMFIGIFINVCSYRLFLQGLDCGMEPSYFYFGMVIYGSYAILFLHFFLTRYFFVASKEKQT